MRLERAPRRLPRVESVERAIRDPEEAGERTEPSLLEHWTDKEIAELGFAPKEVALLRRSKADNLLDVKDAVEFTNEAKLAYRICKEVRQGAFNGSQSPQFAVR